MIKHTLVVLLTAAMLIAMVGGAVVGRGKPPKPPAAPCDASTIKVHNNSLCGETMWIDVLNSTTVDNILCPPCNKKPADVCDMVIIGWIGGTVVADAAYEHGFYFEPNSVIVAEITAEGMQTSICQIAANPGMYDGGTWYITYQPLAIEEL